MHVYGEATSVLALDRARQLTENGCAATVLHVDAEIGTLPIDYGVHGARRGVRMHNVMTQEFKMHFEYAACLNTYISTKTQRRDKSRSISRFTYIEFF
jgi:hypothetical protein